MRRVLITAITTLILLLAAGPAHAQGPWTLEVRGGANLATEEFAGVDLETGVGFEANLALRVAPVVALYGGWDWQHRRVKDQPFGRTEDVEDTGYVFGVRLAGADRSRLTPWLRLGALYNHVELEDFDGAPVADSEHVWGWEAGGGLAVPMGRSWQLTPGVRYRHFEPAVRFGGAELTTPLSYVVLDVGLALRF